MPYLITKTLLDSWNYALSARGDTQEEAYEEFLCTLHRVPTVQTAAMQNGIAFEDEVYKQARGENRAVHPKWEEGICKVADIIKGAATQIRLSTPIQVAGEDVLLYGILDAMRAGTIYDVKFSGTSFASAELAGKYLSSAQHPLYLRLAPEALAFEYVVSDGADVYTERYTRKSSQPAEQIVTEFFDFLHMADIWKDYKKFWKAK